MLTDVAMKTDARVKTKHRVKGARLGSPRKSTLRRLAARYEMAKLTWYEADRL